MNFIIYRLSDKQVVKKFNDLYETKCFLEGQRYHKKANFTGFLRPHKSLSEMDLAVGSSDDISIIKKGWLRKCEFVVQHGPTFYALATTSGILQSGLNIWRKVKNGFKRHIKKIIRCF